MTVEWVGELRAVHRDGDARPRIRLSEIEPRPETFALGPLAGLRGEITVIDGKVSVSRVEDGNEQVEGGLEHDAAFLVFGRVVQWQSVDGPHDPTDKAGFERWLADAAATAGLPQDRPFPFKIETSASSLSYHVLARTEPGHQVTQPHDELMRRFTLDAQPLTILGIHSTKHAGVFTHHGETTHLHMATADGLHSGHVDGLTLAAGSTVYLPGHEKR